MSGLSLLQRWLTPGKALAFDDGAALIAWARMPDGAEFVGTVQQLTDLINQLSAAPVVTQRTVSYTATVTDAFTLIEFTGAAAKTFSLPTDALAPLMGLQSVIGTMWVGTGVLSWPAGIVPGTPTAVGGVTYDVPVGLGTPVRLVQYMWRKRAANEWVLS